MLCIHCRKETPDTELYCRYCGMKLDVTFDEITTKLAGDNKQERMIETEKMCRWILMIVIIILIAGIYFKSYWQHVPTTTVIPSYIPTCAIPEQYSEMHEIIILPEITNKK